MQRERKKVNTIPGKHQGTPENHCLAFTLVQGFPHMLRKSLLPTHEAGEKFSLRIYFFLGKPCVLTIVQNGGGFAVSRSTDPHPGPRGEDPAGSGFSSLLNRDGVRVGKERC